MSDNNTVRYPLQWVLDAIESDDQRAEFTRQLEYHIASLTAHAEVAKGAYGMEAVEKTINFLREIKKEINE